MRNDTLMHNAELKLMTHTCSVLDYCELSK